MASATKSKYSRDQVMLNMPADFLRIGDSSNEKQINLDQETALALQHQYANYNVFSNNIKGRLVITVNEAKLVKNYGVTRMDPYVRLRIGHQIYETRTCYRGGKNPQWNRIFLCFLPNGVNRMAIEIYDECAFTQDEKVAWAEHTIPPQIFDGETVESWITLNGKQGDGKEGTICIILSFTPLVPGTAISQPHQTGAQIIPATVGGQPITVSPAPPPQPQVIIKEEEVNQIQEMFPNIDQEVIRTVLESSRGNKERAINNLIQMSSS
ncbi:toll-interacting protein-like [Brevipalpus obovatus]|uniref:toll-interacting protein-like n=1 Tax=Brevipalpus obovatus TaxID=246614 RepID=UPI003D9E2E45